MRPSTEAAGQARSLMMIDPFFRFAVRTGNGSFPGLLSPGFTSCDPGRISVLTVLGPRWPLRRWWWEPTSRSKRMTQPTGSTSWAAASRTNSVNPVHNRPHSSFYPGNACHKDLTRIRPPLPQRSAPRSLIRSVSSISPNPACVVVDVSPRILSARARPTAGTRQVQKAFYIGGPTAYLISYPPGTPIARTLIQNEPKPVKPKSAGSKTGRP